MILAARPRRNHIRPKGEPRRPLPSRGWHRLRLERLEDRTLFSASPLANALVPVFRTFGSALVETAQASGFLADSGQADLYRVRLRSGDVLSAAVSAQAEGSGLQSLLRIFDAAGKQVALDDQEGGDPQLRFQAATDGVYYVGVSSAPNDAYDPTQLDSGTRGGTTGLYTLNLRDTPAQPLQPDLAGSYFRLHTDTAAYGETISGSFMVENRGGLAAGAFAVQVVLSGDQLFRTGKTVLTTFSVPGLAAGQALTLGSFPLFTATLPGLASLPPGQFPASGPVYLGLQIVPRGTTPDLRAVHRGEDWETLTVVEPFSDSANNLNGRVSGTLTNGQTDSYQVMVPKDGDGQLNVNVVATGGTLLPRVSLMAPGQAPLQSDDGSLLQHLAPGVYRITVSARSGTGTYRLTTRFERASSSLNPLPVGTYPAAVTMADVNGDGYADLILANETDDTAGVLLSNGDGTFRPQQTYPVGKSPDAVAVADLDGDGRPDLIVANKGNNTVTVLLGHGDGTFENDPASLYGAFGVGSDPDSVAVADLNGDGNPDLVVSNQLNLVLSNLLNQNDHPTGYGTVSALLGNGKGAFKAQQTVVVGYSNMRTVGIRSVAVADFNGDGIPDLVVAKQNQAAAVVLGVGDGSFRLRQNYPIGQGAVALAAGDLNGDGVPDIVVANASDGTVSVLLGPTRRTVLHDNIVQPLLRPDLSQGTIAVGSNPYSVALADFNGDGKRDLVVANRNDNSVTVLLGDGDGTFQPPQTFLVGFNPTSVTVGDVNGDGVPDLVVANAMDNTLTVLIGNGDGTFQPQRRNAVGSKPVSLAVGDFNGDGKPDVVVADVNAGSDTISVRLGNGDGTFGLDPFASPKRSPGTFAVGASPDAVAVADLNGDGKPDLIVGNSGSTTLSVLLGDGDGNFQPQPTIDVGSHPQAVTAADVNGDGRPDLIVRGILPSAGSPGVVTVLLNRGDGTFQPDPFAPSQNPRGSFPVGSYSAVSVADVNGDGEPDLVVADYTTGAVTVLQGDGRGRFLARPPSPLGPYAKAVTVDHLHGDFYPDLVVANSIYGTLNVLRGNGDGTFQPAQTYPVGDPPSSVVAADVNGDGMPDLVTGNVNSRSLNVLLSTADGRFQPDPFSPPGMHKGTFAVGPQPTSVAVADINGDGKPDLLVANEGDSTLTVLLGNGKGGFTPTASTAGVDLRNTPHAADLTGDGRPDAVVLDDGGHIVVRLGQANGDFGPPPPTPPNPDRPARDLTVLRTSAGLAVATADAGFDPTRSNSGQLLYTVSLYVAAPDGSMTRHLAFTTPFLPTRIAALPDGALDDLVVADSFDNQIQVAFQRPDGTFEPPLTLPTDADPSDLALVDVNADGRCDVVVSNQESGDVSVFLNEGNHSFTGPFNFRAGTASYALDTTTGAPSDSSLSQSVSLAAGDFTGGSGNDLVVVNRGTHQFTVLSNDGSSGFADPQAARAFSTSSGFSINNEPGPVVAGHFRGVNQPLDLAILMKDAAQVWVFAGDGHGGFQFSSSVAVSGSPTGLSLTSNPQTGLLDLLVGDQFGDIQPLQGNGDGTFQPPPPGERVPLAINDQQQVLLANQKTDQVLLETRVPGSERFTPTAVVDSHKPFGPVYVESYHLDRGSSPADAVALGSTTNSLYVYRFDPLNHRLERTVYPVGTDPVSVTIQDLNADGIPDLLVVNRGSNDISVLFGDYDANGDWFGNPGPRLKSGGTGPIGVSLLPHSGTNPNPSLLVTNSQSGNLSVLPGVGQGFFNDQSPTAIPIPASNPQATQPFLAVGPAGNGVLVTGDGQLLGFNAGTSRFTSPVGAGVDAVTVLRGSGTLQDRLFTVSGRGTVAELDPVSLEGVSENFISATGIPSEPSALQALGTGTGVQVLVTSAGSDTVFVFGLSLGPDLSSPEPNNSNILPPSPPGPPVIVVTAPSEAPLAPLVTLSVGVLTDSPPVDAVAPDQSAAGGGAQAGGGGEEGQPLTVALLDADSGSGPGPSVEELLRKINLDRKPQRRFDDPFAQSAPTTGSESLATFWRWLGADGKECLGSLEACLPDSWVGESCHVPGPGKSDDVVWRDWSPPTGKQPGSASATGAPVAANEDGKPAREGCVGVDLRPLGVDRVVGEPEQSLSVRGWWDRGLWVTLAVAGLSCWNRSDAEPEEETFQEETGAEKWAGRARKRPGTTERARIQ